MKGIMGAVLWVLFLLLPVGVTAWIISDGYAPWWVSALAGCGAVLIEALIVNLAACCLAMTKEVIWENRRKKRSTNK